MCHFWQRSKSTAIPRVLRLDRELSEAHFQEVVVPGYVSINSLERALKIDGTRLRALNPALLRAVWDGQRHVPKSYHLRLPIDGEKWTSDMLAQRLSPSEMFAGQPQPRHYRVQKGDTIVSVAGEYGISPESLARLNRIKDEREAEGGSYDQPSGAAGHAGRRRYYSRSAGSAAVACRTWRCQRLLLRCLACRPPRRA